MTTYKTGNPIGSTKVKDLYDNAENLDEFVNSQSKLTHPDRRGVSRKTWHGMEQDFSGFMDLSDQAFQQFLLSSGYEDIGEYGAGLLIERRNQVFRYNDELYRAAADLELPYTTNGVWGDEGGGFVSVGDAVLRQQLSDETSPHHGSGMTAFSGGIRYKAGSIGAALQSSSRIPDLYLEADHLETLESTCSISRCYFKRAPFGWSTEINYVFGVGSNMNGHKTAEWLFMEDADGFWRVRYPYAANIRESSEFVDGIPDGDYPTSVSNPFFRTTAIGSTITIEFTGVGFIFNHYTDPRGGMFSVVIDGVDFGSFTTNSAGAASANIRRMITNTLQYGPHTAVLTFTGADPSNPPAEGGPIGWFKLSTAPGSTFSTATVITGNEMHMNINGAQRMALDILEFPISARPEDEPMWPNSFFPKHGSTEARAIRVMGRRLFIDGNPVALQALGADEFEISSFRMEQDIVAYNESDDELSKPLFQGTIIHAYERGRLRMYLDYMALRDVRIGSAYSGDLSSEIPNFATDNGFAIEGMEYPPNGAETASFWVGQCRSASYRDVFTKNSIACRVGSLSSAQSLLAQYASDIEQGCLFNIRPLSSSGVGNSKIYWLLTARNTTIPAGTRLRHWHEYFVGVDCIF